MLHSVLSFVMASLTYELPYIWNQLKPKLESNTFTFTRFMEATILNLYDAISGDVTWERKLFLVVFLSVCLRTLHITSLSYFELINRKYLQVYSDTVSLYKGRLFTDHVLQIHTDWSDWCMWHTLKLIKYCFLFLCFLDLSQSCGSVDFQRHYLHFLSV